MAYREKLGRFIDGDPNLIRLFSSGGENPRADWKEGPEATDSEIDPNEASVAIGRAALNGANGAGQPEDTIV